MTIPKYCLNNMGLETARQFKSLKRKEVRRALRAVDDLRTGCSFLPSGDTRVQRIQKELDQLKQELAVKNWGN
jgi:hypothetical protein